MTLRIVVLTLVKGCMLILELFYKEAQDNAPTQSVNLESPYDFHPPDWITDTRLRRSPFVPQMGDEVRIKYCYLIYSPFKLAF